eukprot:333511-Prymnesium_polylepis.1
MRCRAIRVASAEMSPTVCPTVSCPISASSSVVSGRAPRAASSSSASRAVRPAAATSAAHICARRSSSAR